MFSSIALDAELIQLKTVLSEVYGTVGICNRVIPCARDSTLPATVQSKLRNAIQLAAKVVQHAVGNDFTFVELDDSPASGGSATKLAPGSIGGAAADPASVDVGVHGSRTLTQ